MATILDKLEIYFAPEINILYKKYIFHIAEQQTNETVDQYILHLRRLAEPCKFEALHEDMFHNRLVLGTRDNVVSAQLFREKEDNLAKAIKSLRISEAMQE